MPQDHDHDHEDLDDAIAKELDVLVQEGTDLLEAGKDEAAREKFEAGIALLPEPKHHWVASTWLYASVANIHFDAQRWEDARENFAAAMKSPSGTGNPFIQLRMGQSEFELGNMGEAFHRLLFARMRGPQGLLDEVDAKYGEFVDAEAARREQGASAFRKS